MNQNRQWLIGIGIVAGLCICAGAVALLVMRAAVARVTDSFKTDPTGIAAVGDRIAEFDVPPGYQEAMAMSFFTYDMVSIAPLAENSSDPIIMLMQFTGGAAADPRQMQEAMQQQTGQSASQMTVVETREETIRGEAVIITISESTSSGFKLRQWMTVFQGNHGPAFLMVQGPAAAWDEQLITDFIHSIR